MPWSGINTPVVTLQVRPMTDLLYLAWVRVRLIKPLMKLKTKGSSPLLHLKIRANAARPRQGKCWQLDYKFSTALQCLISLYSPLAIVPYTECPPSNILGTATSADDCLVISAQCLKYRPPPPVCSYITGDFPHHYNGLGPSEIPAPDLSTMTYDASKTDWRYHDIPRPNSHSPNLPFLFPPQRYTDAIFPYAQYGNDQPAEPR